MKNKSIITAASLSVLSLSGAALANDEPKATVDFNLRYENVDQDTKDADALTLRTRLTYQTATKNGFSGLVEFEDSRVVAGMDDYKYGPMDSSNTTDAVIADPETTELDQAFVQYKQDAFTAKVGRQVITLDGHRYVGHVGWRQDRQTFDAATLSYSKDKFAATYSHIVKRNRIFGEEGDLDSSDNLLNASYKTSFGKVVGYAYLLDQDDGAEIDTYGASLSGKKDKFSYTVEFATQENGDFDADYMNLAAGYNFGAVTAKVGYEVLGSDDGMYGFSTPLATLHKFNGWADSFLSTPAEGLVDVSVTFSGKLGGGSWLAKYHDFSADEDSSTVDDLGSEFDLQYVRKIYKNYTVGVKYAAYSAGDIKVDTDKVWLWVGAKF